ncbi:MAG: hypothetical protein KJZ54_13760 [Phycisphaerales bacterium]|nr:hypothetical protein [Phycisphaerales bacterium]
MDMYLVEIHAVPEPTHDDGTVGGAYVVCWIEAPDLDDAVRRARAEIVDAGWRPGELRRGHVTTREEYTGDNDGQLEYFEQALIDKEVCVFYSYPVHDEPE